MKKILYLMAIDWYWIKQRPQIIAEMISKDYDVTVAYYKEIFVKQLLRKTNDQIEKSIPVAAIPYRDKNIIAYNIQKFIFYHKIIKDINEFDIVWLGHPLLYRYIPQSYQGKIVYDCMDNHEAFCEDRIIKRNILLAERKLADRADCIFASSYGLKEKLNVLTDAKKVVLVRNGFVLDKIHFPEKRSDKTLETYKIGYFGTIAQWFDFSLLLESLKRFSNIEYYIWGPTSGVDIPKHPRIKIQGVIEHAQLFDATREMDCFIMPFKVNDIIKAVDPVKLYEYISLGKTVISVYYDEIKRFSPYVYFYSSPKEYYKLLAELLSGQKENLYDRYSQQSFLSENTWTQRYEVIKLKLSEL